MTIFRLIQYRILLISLLLLVQLHDLDLYLHVACLTTATQRGSFRLKYRFLSMARIEINDDDLSWTLSSSEAFWSLAFCCPPRNKLSNIRSVRAVDNIWAEKKGIRLCGTGVPFVAMLGTRAYCEGYDFCIVYYNTPGLVIEFNSGRHKRWLLSTPNNVEIVADIENRREAFMQSSLISSTNAQI